MWHRQKEILDRGDTSESEIKSAYLEKAKIFHPDAQPGNNQENNFDKINKAYHTLLDYSMAIKQSSKNDYISLTKEKVIGNLFLVKIRE